MSRPGDVLTLICGLGLALVLTGCADSPVETEVAAEVADLVWPPAPAPARLRYRGAFTRGADLGVEPGLLARIADVLFGDGEPALIRPMAVVADGDVVHVADPGSRGVHRFDRTRGRHDLLRLEDGRPLPSPVGLASAPDGAVMVTDSVLRALLRIAPGAQAAVRVPVSVELGQPTGVAVDPRTGNVLVADTAAHAVLVLAPDGRLIRVIGHRGEAPGNFNFPTYLWIDSAGHLYVTDSLNFRVQVLDLDGRPLAWFGRAGDASGDIGRHKGVAVDRQGHVYLADGLFQALQVFDRQGRFLLSVGQLGDGAGEFWLPTGVFVDGDDRVYVADSYNRRVQVFEYVGGAR